MKKFLLFCFLIQGCADKTAKRMIIEPDPPAVPQAVITECHLKFAHGASLSEIAAQAARIADECNYNDKDFNKMAEAEYR